MPVTVLIKPFDDDNDVLWGGSGVMWARAAVGNGVGVGDGVSVGWAVAVSIKFAAAVARSGYAVDCIISTWLVIHTERAVNVI